MNAKKSKRNEKSTVDKRMYFEINKASFKSHLHHFCDFFFFSNHIISQASVTSQAYLIYKMGLSPLSTQNCFED